MKIELVSKTLVDLGIEEKKNIKLTEVFNKQATEILLKRYQNDVKVDDNDIESMVYVANQARVVGQKIINSNVNITERIVIYVAQYYRNNVRKYAA